MKKFEIVKFHTHVYGLPIEEGCTMSTAQADCDLEKQFDAYEDALASFGGYETEITPCDDYTKVVEYAVCETEYNEYGEIVTSEVLNITPMREQ